MPTHQGRRGVHPAQKDPRANPKPDALKKAREETGLSQREAAELIYSTERTWQDWELGQRRMHPALWELWRAKVYGATFEPLDRESE
jgi:DNA-binding transcriptional regulator YiaG